MIAVIVALVLLIVGGAFSFLIILGLQAEIDKAKEKLRVAALRDASAEVLFRELALADISTARLALKMLYGKEANA